MSTFFYFFVFCSSGCLALSDSDLMKKLVACVGVFSLSAVNNDVLKELQKLEEDLHRI